MNPSVSPVCWDYSLNNNLSASMQVPVTFLPVSELSVDSPDYLACAPEFHLWCYQTTLCRRLFLHTSPLLQVPQWCWTQSLICLDEPEANCEEVRTKSQSQWSKSNNSRYIFSNSFIISKQLFARVYLFACGEYNSVPLITLYLALSGLFPTFPPLFHQTSSSVSHSLPCEHQSLPTSPR